MDDLMGMPELDAVDPDAPYGRKADGTPYKISALRRAELGAQMAAGRSGKAKAPAAGRTAAGPKTPPRKPTPNSAKAPTKTTEERADSVRDFLQIPVALLAMGGNLYQPLLLDSMAVELSREDLAEGIADAAENMPTRVVAWIDKITSVGPYAKLANAFVKMGAQIATNHGIIPPNRQLGTVGPTDLVLKFADHVGVDDGDQ